MKYKDIFTFVKNRKYRKCILNIKDKKDNYYGGKSFNEIQRLLKEKGIRDNEGRTYKEYKGNDVPYNISINNFQVEITKEDIDNTYKIIKNIKGERDYFHKQKKYLKNIIDSFNNNTYVLDNVVNSDGSKYEVKVYKTIAGKMQNTIYKNNNNETLLISLFNKLPEIIKTSNYVVSGEFDNHTGINIEDAGIYRYDYLINKVNIGEKNYIVQMDVIVTKDGNRLRTYNIVDIKMMETNSSQVYPVPSNPSFDLKLSQELDDVKYPYTTQDNKEKQQELDKLGIDENCKETFRENRLNENDVYKCQYDTNEEIITDIDDDNFYNYDNLIKLKDTNVTEINSKDYNIKLDKNKNDNSFDNLIKMAFGDNKEIELNNPYSKNIVYSNKRSLDHDYITLINNKSESTILMKLKEVFSNAVPLNKSNSLLLDKKTSQEIVNENSNNIKYFAEVKLDGDMYIVRFIVKDTNKNSNGINTRNKLYSINSQKKETGNVSSTSSITISIKDLINDVNSITNETASNKVASNGKEFSGFKEDLPQNVQKQLNGETLSKVVADGKYINKYSYPIQDIEDNINDNELLMLEESYNKIVKENPSIKTFITNRNITFDNNLKDNIDGVFKNNKIYINSKSIDNFYNIFIHELTHSLENKRRYIKLSRILKDYDYKLTLKWLNKLQKAIDIKGNRLYTDELIQNGELTARLAGDLLGNKEFIDRLVKNQTSLAYRIYDSIKSLAYKDDDIRKVEKLFIDTFRENGLSENDGVKYLIETNDKGKKYAKFEDLVIEGNDPELWSDQITNYIKNKIKEKGYVDVFTKEGTLLRINDITAGKMGYQGNLDNDQFRVKAEAAGVLDDVLKVSDYNKEKPNKKERKDNFVKWQYRTAFFEDSKGDKYKLDISIGIDNKNNKISYNIGNIEKRSKIKKVDSAAASTNVDANNLNLSKQNISSDNEDVKFSKPINNTDKSIQKELDKLGIDENCKETFRENGLNENDVIKYAIKIDKKGRYVLTDGNIFQEHHVSHKNRRKFLESYIKNNLRIKAINEETGNILQTNKNSSKYASPENRTIEIYIKGKLIGNIDEVFEISNFDRWESSKKTAGVDTKRNPEIGKKGFDFYTFRFAIPTQEGMTMFDAELKINKESTGDYLYDIVILNEKKGVPTPMVNPSPEPDTPAVRISSKKSNVKHSYLIPFSIHDEKEKILLNKKQMKTNLNSLVCKRCGNSDLTYFYKGSKGYYCRKCISFKRALINEDIDTTEYEIQDDAYEYFFKYELTKYQRNASSQILKYTIQGKDVLLEAVCGAGKTELVVETISYYLAHHKKVCYAISRKEVVKELSIRFASIFKNAKVLGVYGGHHNELTGDLIVCTTHQLFRYYKTFNLLVLDEVDAFPLNGNIPLMNISLNSCIGSVIFSTATSNNFLKEVLSTRNYELVSLKIRPSLKPLTIPIVKYHLILFRLFSILLNSNERFIVFTSTKKEVLRLYYLFKYLKSCTYVYSDLDSRDKNILDFKDKKYDVIFSTSVLERGITIENINVILYMNSNRIIDKSSIIQMIGRVGRGIKYTNGKAYILSNNRYEDICEVLNYLKEANDALSLL